ncbi:hypothetical protein [Paracidovorax valerianellae]|uniref:Uncharacterized protein n=1 Tax=Paracidovorax valerianellae TaxID=187868 RepID=A0A1G6S0J3_9BURK|nr:hypothetical protein [Paracidovorax valerianellae]MDA8444149.1 hypothetical protein [Paracidovorax valerianellae]SDD10379.1 hypothetical protein SAMN05192589_104300 [Paracidovorax valerianellae]
MKPSHLSHAKSPRGAPAQEEAPPKPSQRSASSSANAPHALAGGSPRHPSSGGGIRPRSDNLQAPVHPESRSSVFSTVRGFMSWGSSSSAPVAAPEPDPQAWLDSNVSKAKAARQRLLDNAAPLPKHVNSASPLAGEPYQLDTYVTFNGPEQNIVLVPAKELLPGFLRSDQFIELSSDQLKQANALSTTHPGVTTQMPDLEPQLHVISPAVAANLALAREAIDLVKALLPGGAGNQIKDMAATGGESYLRSALSYAHGGRAADHAFEAILYQGGYCVAQASLTFELLSRNPALKDSKIDMVHGPKHVFVVIRGETPEHDIVVDPWTPFASPTFAQDALPLHREILEQASESVRQNKAAGSISSALDIKEALRRQGFKNQSSISDLFQFERYRDPKTAITKNLEGKEDRWDVPFSGNPNVRYEVRDASGSQLTEFPLRFDMQRAASAPNPHQA